MAAFPCAVEPLLDTPSSLPAVQLQLRMVESSIASAEHDLEARGRNQTFVWLSAELTLQGLRFKIAGEKQRSSFSFCRPVG